MLRPVPAYREARVELARLRRLPAWLAEAPRMARARGGDDFDAPIARHGSPLRRAGTTCDPRLQAGKEQNVAVAAARLDRVIIRPGQTLSYHHLVGRPSRSRGFLPGLELHDGRPAEGVGGGACQVANLLYYLALIGGMNVTERHRHSLDLFPDAGRRVPFGCGATVFYNWADLRFVNPLDVPVVLRLGVHAGEIVGELWAPVDPGFRAEVYQVDHRFFERDGAIWRENRVRRRIVRTRDGQALVDHEVAHNLGRVAYELPRELLQQERAA
jgi:vancomycin resistance protein VanW